MRVTFERADLESTNLQWSTLQWYVQNGVDETLCAHPVPKWQVSAPPVKPEASPAPVFQVAETVAPEILPPPANDDAWAPVYELWPEQAQLLIIAADLTPQSEAEEMLGKMLAAIGIDYAAQARLMIASASPVTAIHRHLADKNIPGFVVCVGDGAARALHDLRSAWQDLKNCPPHDYGNVRRPTGFVFHPAFLRQSPKFKRQAWEDLKAIAARLAEDVHGASAA